MAYSNDETDETTLRPEWADRPRVGDTVEVDRLFRGKVEATFYRNGEGGMHVQFSHGLSWVSCHRSVIIERVPRSSESNNATVNERTQER